jgi:hypothetical protein
MPSVRTVAGAPPSARRSAPRWMLPALVGCLLLGGLVGRLTAPSGRRAARPSAPSTLGPTHTIAGVPLGFAHSPAGAVAALTAYSTILSNPQVSLNSRRRKQVLSLIASPAYLASFHGQAATGYTLTGAGLPSVFFLAPIAYRIVHYDESSATVLGFSVAVFNALRRNPRALWGTSVTTARWVRDNWQIVESHTSAGPSPALATDQRPSTTAAFLSTLRGARELRHVP